VAALRAWMHQGADRWWFCWRCMTCFYIPMASYNSWKWSACIYVVVSTYNYQQLVANWLNRSLCFSGQWLALSSFSWRSVVLHTCCLHFALIFLNSWWWMNDAEAIQKAISTFQEGLRLTPLDSSQCSYFFSVSGPMSADDRCGGYHEGPCAVHKSPLWGEPCRSHVLLSPRFVLFSIGRHSIDRIMHFVWNVARGWGRI
jgi:hypothetical protein